MKAILNFTFILASIAVAVCCKNKPALSPGNWETGTSTSVFTKYTQEEFNDFKKNGFKYLELGSWSFRKDSAEDRVLRCKRLKETLDSAGLIVWSIHLPYGSIYDISATDSQARERAVSELAEVIELGKIFGPKKYVIHGSSDIKNEGERAARIKSCIASLKVLNEEVKKQGAQLALECLSRSCLGNTSTEILEIANSAGNGIGICFDSNHLMQEKPEEFVKKAGGLICTVHISDYEGEKSLHWLPGRGNTNWANVVSALLKTGYRGPFMFEVKNKAGEPLIGAEELAGSWEFIKNEYYKTSPK